MISKKGFYIKFSVDGSVLDMQVNAYNESNAWSEVLQYYPTATLMNISGTGRIYDPYS